MKHRKLAVTAALAASALLLAACATPSGSSPAPSTPPTIGFGTVLPEPPAGVVIAQGTVMDVGGTVELCLGAVAESYPPQCSGIPIANWTWDGVEFSESAGDVQWGAYAVQGTYDGTSFTVAGPPMALALYDPAAPVDPFDGKPGMTDEKTLLEIQDELPDRLGAAYFGSWPRDGRLWVQVLWDDGTWQDAADEEFGQGVVVIQSALVPVS